LFLLLLTEVEEEACLALTELLRQATKLRLLHPETGAGLTGLNAELAVLSSETADALSNLSRLLRALKPHAPRCFCAGHAKLRLRLPKLAVLLSQLPGKLLCAHAKLGCALGNVCLGGGACHAELPRLLGKLPRELGSVHAGAGGKLLNVHTRLGLSLSVGRSELLGRKPRLGSHLSPREAKLASLKGSGLGELLCREAELAGGLRSLLPLGRKGLSISRGLVGSREAELTSLNPAALCQLLSRHAQSPALLGGLCCKLLRGQALSTALEESGLRQLLSRKPRLGRKLLCREAKLSRSLRLLGGKLFGRKAKTPGGLCRPELSFCALRAQSTGELSGLLGPSLLRFKGLLCPLRGRFKTLSPELSRGPRLLLQYISRALGFLNPLPCATKRPRAHCLGALSLGSDVTLAADVRQRLVDDLLLVRAHELSNRSGVVHGRGAGQSCNTLLRRRRTHAASGLELAGSFCGDAPGARNGLLRLRAAARVC
jgi:hypothetical protein